MHREGYETRPGDHWRPGRGWVLAILAGVSSIAIAQPLLEILAHNPQFLLSHQLNRGDIIMLVAGLLLLPPLPLWLIVLALGGRSDDRLLRVLGWLVAALMTVAFIPPLGRGLEIQSWILIPLGAALAGALTWVASRSKTLRPHLGLLGWVPLLIALVFVGRTRTRDLIFPPAPTPPTASADSTVDPDLDPDPGPDPEIPVIVVVFDALPTISLMDADGRIDSARYPHFARLADDAVWYRNALSISDDTVWIIPSILTGHAPRRGGLPIHDWYPDNLFSWLSPSRPIFSFESHTRLAARAATMSTATRWRLTLADLGVLFLHVVVPADLAGWLPSVSHDWKGFWAGGLTSEELKLTLPPRVQLFRDFLDSFSAARPAGCYFIHSVLPHTPYRFLPSGAAYSRDGKEPGGEGMQWEHWSENAAAVRQSQQRHLLQLGYVDRLVGELVTRLRELGIYERTLIVVTADHGVSFRVGETRRKFSTANSGDIVAVPLLVKYPDSCREGGGGKIDDRIVCVTDILPTIAAALGSPLPWPRQGGNLLDLAFVGHDSLTYSIEHRDVVLMTEEVLADREASLQRRLGEFGAGPDRSLLFAPPRDAVLLGRQTPSAPPSLPGVELDLVDAGLRRVPDPESGLLPAVAAGGVRGPDVPVEELGIAVALDGVIRAVAQPHTKVDEDGWRLWSVLLPEEYLPPGEHRIDALLVDWSTGVPLLYASDEDSASPGGKDSR